MNVAKSRTCGHRVGAWPWLAAMGLALVLSAPAAYGQGAFGRVTGTVRDTTGAVIPGAEVVLQNVASGTQLKTTSGSDGIYTINYVPPATYTLKVTSTGFKAYVRSAVSVEPSQILTIDAPLQVGEKIQTVEVKGAAVNLIPKTQGGEMRTITASQIQNLSTVGRDAMELLPLLPGVVGSTGIPGGPGADFTKGSGFQVNNTGVSSFNVNGLRSDQNMIKLDNATIIDPGADSGWTVEPNMDMIQEFTVKTSGFEASQGNSGIIVEAVTKSGGSKIHGEGYWYLRNSLFNANDWSNNFVNVPKSNYKFNYPGFNIGGPVRIPGTDFNKNNDKMFFFYGVEFQRQLADPGTQLKVMPSAAMRNGDFSGLWTAPNSTCTKNANGVVTGGNFLNMPCIVNKITGGAAPGNVLPASEVTADGQDFINHTYLFPTPGYLDPKGGANMLFHQAYPENRIENTIRVDYNLTQNTRAFLRLAQNSDHEYYPYGLWWGSGIPRITPDVGHLSGESATLNVVQVINPTLTNEVQFSMNGENYPWHVADPSKVDSTLLSQDLKGFNWQEKAGGSYFNRDNPVPYIWDGVDGTGSDNWTGSAGTGSPAGTFGNKTVFELSDNLTKVKGTHTFQFGADILHMRNDQNGGNAPVTQGRLWSTNWGDGGSTGNLFGDLLDQGFTQYAQNSNNPDGLWRFWNYEFYAQDSWKVTRRLTLNYGARIAYLPPWYEARGMVSNFNPDLWTVADNSNVNDGVIVGSGIKTAEAQPYFPSNLQGQFNNTGLASSGGFPTPGIWIEPRFGFAYDVFGNGNTVVRAGGGVFDERDQGNTVFGAAQNPPFVFADSINFTTNASQAGGGFAKIPTVDPNTGQAGASLLDMHDSKLAGSYEWNFTLDQNIGHQTVVEAAYVGNVGRHLYIGTTLGPIPLGGLWTPGTELLAPGATNCSGTNACSFRHYQPFGALVLEHHEATSNYNSMQVTVRRNVSHGLTLLASYTYSKTMGYAGNFQGTVDPFDSRLNYGLQSYDRPEVLSVSYIYQLPNMGAKYFSGNRFAGGALDGWQISGISNWQSGQPLAISAGLGINGSSGCVSPDNSPLCGGQYWSSGNPNLMWYGTSSRAFVPEMIFNGQKGASFNGVYSHWLNSAAVTLPQINKPGSYEMPQMLGPASNNWDLTLFKSFNLPGEGRRLEFRVAAFDMFNRAQLNLPNTGTNFNWVLPAGATALSQGQPSTVLDTSSNCSSGYQFGCILGKTGHREMEFALKLYF